MADDGRRDHARLGHLGDLVVGVVLELVERVE
jgi:hypothetical protein